MVALTLAPNEEQLLAALDDGGLWALDLTRLNNLPVRRFRGRLVCWFGMRGRTDHRLDRAEETPWLFACVPGVR